LSSHFFFKNNNNNLKGNNMIYVNGKMVDFKNRKSDYEFADIVSDYHSTINDLQNKHKGSVRFVTRRPLRVDPITKSVRPTKAYSWPNKLKRITPNGVEEWVYSRSVATVKDGVVNSNDPYFQVTRGEVTFRTDEDPDFIYFLLHHRAIKSGRLRIDDPEADQRQRADAMRLESRFKDMIYSENSPLYDDLDKLKVIARKWGVGGVDDKSEPALRNALFDAVQNGENKKKKGQSAHGIDEFLNDFNMGEGVKVGAAIQQAIDKEILSFNRQTNEWMLIVDKDQMPLSLMMVQPTDVSKARVKLSEYLIRNKHDFAVLEKVLKGDAVIKYGQVMDKHNTTIPRTVELESLENATYNDMKKTASELKMGKDAIGKSKEELREMLREKLSEIAQTA
jgi:hypothetical protein